MMGAKAVKPIRPPRLRMKEELLKVMVCSQEKFFEHLGMPNLTEPCAK